MKSMWLEWFAARGWKPFPFQRATWAAALAGESGLVHAPTGLGKTCAVWGGPLLDWLERNPDRARWPKQSEPLQVLWLTPLRALASDTAEALRLPLTDLGVPWSVALRTGDTSSAVRQKQRKGFPTALITTPESLSLLLFYNRPAKTASFTATGSPAVAGGGPGKSLLQAQRCYKRNGAPSATVLQATGLRFTPSAGSCTGILQ